MFFFSFFCFSFLHRHGTHTLTYTGVCTGLVKTLSCKLQESSSKWLTQKQTYILFPVTSRISLSFYFSFPPPLFPYLSLVFISASLFLYIIFIIFWPHHEACGTFVHYPGMEACPLQWTHRVLTTGPPGKPHAPPLLNLLSGTPSPHGNLCMAYLPPCLANTEKRISIGATNSGK